jgi:hypothetical protein
MGERDSPRILNTGTWSTLHRTRNVRSRCGNAICGQTRSISVRRIPGRERRYFSPALRRTLGRIVSIDARQTRRSASSLRLSADTLPTRSTRARSRPTAGDLGESLPELRVPRVLPRAVLVHGETQFSARSQRAGRPLGGDFGRQGPAGYLNRTNVRGDAWGLKTLLQAAFVSPDGQSEQAYFQDKIANNLSMWEGAQNVTLTDGTRATHWNWGRNSRSANPYWQSLTGQQPSPIGLWSQGWWMPFRSVEAGRLSRSGYLALGRALLLVTLGIASNTATTPPTFFDSWHLSDSRCFGS